MNTNDADWVEDVRRWYFNGGRTTSRLEPISARRPTELETSALGYEAAHPSLETTHWATPPASAFGTLR